MPNNDQLKLIHIAAKAAGLITGKDDGRYRTLLRQYVTYRGGKATSSKQLNNRQIADLLAVCESLGWQHPGKASDHYRKLADEQAVDGAVSIAQKEAIKYLAADLGWRDYQLNGFIDRMSGGAIESITELTPRMAYNLIEALKQMLSRQTGKSYANLTEIQDDMEVADNGQRQAG